jgi:hypothetical protein
LYNQAKITPEQILKHFNRQHKAIQLTLKEENNKQISYLDLNLSNKQEYIETDIYRKPTSSDIAINNTSCHPGEQKMSTFRYWLHYIPLNDANKNKELNNHTHSEK